MQPISCDVFALNPDTLVAELTGLFDGFERHFESGAFKYRGNGLKCSTDLGEYHDIVCSALALNGRAAESNCRVIVAKAGSMGLPYLRWNQRYFQEREVEARLAKTRFRLHHMPDHGFWQVYDRETKQGIQLMQGTNGYPDWDPGSPLRNFLHWHFVTKNTGLVHAGTLGLDGIGLMLAGPGGSGKSGTVLAGVINAMSSVGDDYVLADIRQDMIFASPLFNTLKQDPGGIRRLALGPSNSIPKDVNWQGKYQFTMVDINPAAMVGHIEIRALCLPNITGSEETNFRNASAKQAFLALAPSGVSQIPGDRDASFSLCAQLSRKLPCYHVDLGTDPREIAGGLRRFIVDHLQ